LVVSEAGQCRRRSVRTCGSGCANNDRIATWRFDTGLPENICVQATDGEIRMRRVVITGLGSIAPLGVGVEAVWTRLRAGQSCIRRLPDTLVDRLPTKVAGVVPDIGEDAQAGFDAEAITSPKEQRKMDRFMLLALAATDDALTQAD